jgi:DNA/RNA endonuclease G (NUC1)
LLKPLFSLLSESRLILTALLFTLAGSPGWARLGVEFQAALGNPDGAVTDAASRTRYLIQRGQYVISYNDDTHQANWVSWSYSLSDDGPASRTDAWAVEELLPAGFLKIGTATFGTGWDRGHMTPSADRLKTTADNTFTFRMSNIIPQASQNNQGLWNNFENYCRSMAADGDEVLVISGPAQFTGSRLGNQMSVPGSVWKIAVEIPNATSATPANQRVTTGARVIALLTPNVNTGLGTWQSYITSVEAIEAVTGLNFFTAMDPSVAIYLKNLVDTGNGPNSPTVLTTFNPTLGPPGTSVVVSGFNLGASPVVAFNGSPAAVTAVGSNSLTVTVPAGATSGAITVTGPGGSDTSYEDFTVTSGSTPTITLSSGNLAGLTAVEGQAGAPAVYAVTGSLLTAPVSLTASGDFEISGDNATFGPSLTLTPGIEGTISAQVYVRIKAGAPLGAVSGAVVHASTGATSRTLNLGGSVSSSSPFLSLSAGSLGGFSAVQGAAGGSKTYTVSGGNLTGAVSVAAPSGFEVSTDNLSFGPSRTLVPVGGGLAAVPVYVRVTSGAPVGAVAGDVVHSGGGAAAVNLPVSGNVLAPGSTQTATFVWDFSQTAPTSGTLATATMSAVSQGNNNGTTALLTNTSASSGYVGASGGSNAAAAARTGALSTATNGSAFFEFTVTPSPGVTFTVSDVTFGTRSTSTGPQAFAVRSSADNFAANLAAGTISNNSAWTLRSNTLAASGTTATSFRIYGFNGSGSATASTANWRIDDLRVTVTAGVTPPPVPVITSGTAVSGTANQPFSYQVAASGSPTGYSASGLPPWLSLDAVTGLISGTPTGPGTFSFIVGASNAGGEGSANVTLVVAPDPNAPVITSALAATAYVGAPFLFQVTASNAPTTFLAPALPAGLAIDPTTGLISGTPVSAGVANVTVTASNASGADSEVLVLTVRNPTVSVSASVAPFSSNLGFAGSSQSYNLTGADLSGPVSVAAPAGFEVSLDGLSYAGEVTITPDSGGNVSSAITVRLSALAGLGENAGTIVHASLGATPKYLEVTGTVVASAPTITLSVPSLGGFSTKTGTASFLQNYTLNGAGLGGPVTVSASAGFELTLDGENFAPSLVLTPVNGRLAAVDVGVRLAAAAPAGSYNGLITHTGGGAAPQSLALTGTVQTLSGPPITSLPSGSVYVGGTFSHTITAGGDLPVTGYGASGLPAGLTVNPTTGVVSGSVATAGSYTFQISASNADDTTTAAYTLRVVSTAEQAAQPLSVAVNKFQNATTDRVELLVVGDSTDAAAGPPVDLRGMILKDFSSNTGADLGGKFVFADNALWASVRAGTLVVLSSGTAAAEDLDASDFVLRANLGNAALFSSRGGTFDLLNNDMIMVKPPAAGLAGIAGGIHALAVGNSGSQYTGFSGRRLRSSNSLGNNRSYVYAANNSATAADFSLSTGGVAANATALTFGSGNTSGNSAFIATLRGLDQTAPVVTLAGAAEINLTVGSTYVEAGATALDAVDGVRSVTVSGAVNTAAAGVYTVTYTAVDAAGNRGTATRTVTVSVPAAPVLTASGTPAALETVYGMASTVTTFGLAATNLVSPVTVTAPTGFEVSLQPAGTYAPSIQAGASGTLPLTTIYVRLSASAPAGLYNGSVVLAATGATEASVPLASSLVALKPVSVSGIAGQDKPYDGSAVASVAGMPVITGLLPADASAVSLGGAPAFLFSDAATGTAKPITAGGFTLIGPAASNYVLTQPEGLTASILTGSLGSFAVTFTPQPGGGFAAEAAGVTGFTYSYAGRGPTSYEASPVPPAAPGLYTVTATSADQNVSGSTSHDFFITGLLLGADEIVRTSGGQAVQLTPEELLANDRWVDGDGNFRSDGLALDAVTGDGAVLESGLVTYAPVSATGGAFDYVAVAGGTSGEAVVSVVIRPLPAIEFEAPGIPVFDAQADVTTITHRLSAPTDTAFAVEYATSVAGPWTSAGSFTNDSTAEIEVTVTVPGDRVAELRRGMFFRAKFAVP